jgi:hypothetical protein
MVDLPLRSHHPQQPFALIQLVSVETAQYPGYVGVDGVIDRHLETQNIQNFALKSYDLLLRVAVLTFGHHAADFGRVDLIHFAGQQQQCQRNLLVVLLAEMD